MFRHSLSRYITGNFIEAQADIYAISKLGPEIFHDARLLLAAASYGIYSENIKSWCAVVRPDAGITSTLSAWIAETQKWHDRRASHITDIIGEITQERAQHYILCHLEEMR